MALNNSQYDAIMREYEQRRLDAKHILDEHKEEVYDIIPEYKKLDESISNIAMESAARVLEGDKAALDEMKNKINEITKRQETLLSDFAFPSDYLEMKYTCPDCKDTGYIDGTKKCHCLIQQINRVLYKQSNIEDILKVENFANLSYDYYLDSELDQMKKIIGECKDFVNSFDDEYTNILLLGAIGVGKTYLSNCIAKELLDTGHSVVYFTAINLFDTLSQYVFHQDTAPDDIADIHKGIFECDLLVIDDLGTETLSSFVSSQLFLILNERDIRHKSTVISANLDLQMFAERYSERNFSRLFGNFKVIRPDIQDIRIKKRRMVN